MDYTFLEKAEYQGIPLLRMEDNHNRLPFFLRTYAMADGQDGCITHRHAYIQINYILRGGGRHFVNDHAFDILCGDIFVIPPYVPHRIISGGDPLLEIFEFEFEPGFIEPSLDGPERTEPFLNFACIEPFLVSENQAKPRLNLSGGIQIEVESLLRDALREYERREPGFDLMIKSALLRLLVMVGREFERSLRGGDDSSVYVRHRDAMLCAVRYIDQNSREDLNADDVARRFLLSGSYFRYLFKNCTGRSFTEYLNRVRVSNAMELLRTTDERVLDICLNTGFGSVNHFNQVFRQWAGMPPLAYRKANRKSTARG